MGCCTNHEDISKYNYNLHSSSIKYSNSISNKIRTLNQRKQILENTNMKVNQEQSEKIANPQLIITTTNLNHNESATYKENLDFSKQVIKRKSTNDIITTYRKSFIEQSPERFKNKYEVSLSCSPIKKKKDIHEENIKKDNYLKYKQNKIDDNKNKFTSNNLRTNFNRNKDLLNRNQLGNNEEGFISKEKNEKTIDVSDNDYENSVFNSYDNEKEENRGRVRNSFVKANQKKRESFISTMNKGIIPDSNYYFNKDNTKPVNYINKYKFIFTDK